jgi:hypothetical protein
VPDAVSIHPACETLAMGAHPAAKPAPAKDYQPERCNPGIIHPSANKMDPASGHWPSGAMPSAATAFSQVNTSSVNHSNPPFYRKHGREGWETSKPKIETEDQKGNSKNC